MHEQRCPDCNISMERVALSAGGIFELFLGTERDGGLLSRLGINEYAPIDPFVCPKCGLIRLYADSEE